MIGDLFFGTQSDISNNPKTKDIKFLHGLIVIVLLLFVFFYVLSDFILNVAALGPILTNRPLITLKPVRARGSIDSYHNVELLLKVVGWKK